MHFPLRFPAGGFRLLRFALLFATGLSVAVPPAAAKGPERAEVLAAMRRATQFMVEKASHQGGYVWSYLPDFSRRWGELEACESMIWIQPPGTGTMGHLFLDAYHATGDEYYYRAAELVAGALIRAQHPSGGWNYVADFAGEESLKKWYATVGRNAWRLEEFQHYYGNATFDDGGTAECAKFLLRIFIEKRDPRYRPALNRAIAFVLDSQYPVGGWPQRFPRVEEHGLHGRPDYTAYITLNDDVVAENLDFLIKCHQALDDRSLLEPIRRGMDCFIATQQKPPQAGWALQYTLDLKPAGARTYEPAGLATHGTASCIELLMKFYRLTGDKKYLEPIPAALAWLDSVRFPKELVREGRAHPTFVEVGTNKPIFLHRRGSNVVNGEYYTDGDPSNTIKHYGSSRQIDVAGLREQYEKLKQMPLVEVTKGSPLLESVPLPRYFTLGQADWAWFFEASHDNESRLADRAERVLKNLNAEGWWPVPLRFTSHPYKCDGAKEIAPGDFRSTNVGDETDTSPFQDPKPATGISTGAFVRNMAALIEYLVGEK